MPDLPDITRTRETRPTRKSRSATISVALGALVMLAAPMGAAEAQVPVIPREWYQNRLDRGGDTIVFCVNQNAMMAPFERDLARAIGATLLLDVEIHDVNPVRPTRPLDYRLPLSEQQLFVTLVENCNAMLGFVLSDSFSEWLTISRPYMNTGYVLAVRDGAHGALADIPRDQAIGTRGMNNGDIALTSYLQALPEANRWRRFPYFDNAVLIDRLLDGTIAAAVIWEPAIHYAAGGDPVSIGVRLLSLPFSPRPTQIGIALLAEDVFLRTALDEAIAALIEDGVVAELMAAHQLAPPPQ